MHYLVKLLVEGKTATEALENAESQANDLVELQEFDWYDMDDGRWGKSKAYSAESKKGKQLIKEGMEASRQEFDNAMKAIRYMMDNFTDDQIYEEDFPKWDDIKDKLPEGIYSLSKWQFSRIGGHSNASCVYSEGSRVESQRSLDAQFKYAKEKLWVVPVDFHN